MKHALETHKVFPLIAWGTFIAFVAFTFYLATKLQSSSTELSGKTAQTVEALNAAP